MYKRVHTAILKIYRDFVSVDGELPSYMFSDDQLIAEYQLMSPDTMIRMRRLCLFTRVFVRAPDILKKLLIAVSSSTERFFFCSAE